MMLLPASMANQITMKLLFSTKTGTPSSAAMYPPWLGHPNHRILICANSSWSSRVWMTHQTALSRLCLTPSKQMIEWANLTKLLTASSWTRVQILGQIWASKDVVPFKWTLRSIWLIFRTRCLVLMISRGTQRYLATQLRLSKRPRSRRLKGTWPLLSLKRMLTYPNQTCRWWSHFVNFAATSWMDSSDRPTTLSLIV